MITSNVIQRIFHLRNGEDTGTCFTIDFENRQYFVTAKHAIEGLKDNDIVEIYFNGKWIKLPITLIGHHNTADVSVFAINTLISGYKMLPSSNGIGYGQDVYFLGFPYQIQDENSSTINRNFPLPLVKKAIISCMTKDETGPYFILDGNNNPGFSGGPVIYTEQNKLEYKVAAIISGYKAVMEPAYYEGDTSPISVKVNTGLIVAYTIENATDLIKLNPIGRIIT